MSTGPARRAGRTAALVVSVVGTAAQAAAHLAASSHAGHVGPDADGRMLLAHLVAAVLTAAVVARRGAALRRLAHVLDAILPAPWRGATPPLPDVRAAVPAAPVRERVLVGRVLATAQRRRGPPTGAVLRPAAA